MAAAATGPTAATRGPVAASARLWSETTTRASAAAGSTSARFCRRPSRHRCGCRKPLASLAASRPGVGELH
jgi:hypothetical protein